MPNFDEIFRGIDDNGFGLTKENFATQLKTSVAKNLKQVGKKAGFLGDSITNNASAGAGRDWTRQLKRILGSGVISDTTSVQAGFPGENSTQIVARYATAIRANGVEILFSMCGTNNIIQGLSLDTYITDIKQLHAETIKDGIPLILMSIPPLGAVEQTATRKEMIVKHNMFLKAYCALYNLPYVDTYTPLATVSGASAGNAVAGYYNVDGIHPNTYGHFYIAKAVASTSAPLITAPHFVDHVVAYNNIANPTMLDTANWLEQAGGTGSAAVYTTETDLTGKIKYGKWYQAAWNATTGGAKYVRSSSINFTTAGIVTGDQLLITARCDYEDVEGNYEFNATPDNPTCALYLFVMDSAFVQRDVLDAGAVAKPGPVTKIFTVPAGMTGLIIAMQIKLNTGRNVKFKIGEVGVFKVTGMTEIISMI